MITLGSGYRHKFIYGMVREIGISIQIIYTGNLYLYRQISISHPYNLEQIYIQVIYILMESVMVLIAIMAVLGEPDDDLL